MERFCSKCGTLVNGDGAFCPQCGAPMESAVNLNKPAAPEQSAPVQSQPYVTPMQNVQPSQNTGYSQSSMYNSGGNQAQMPNYPQSANVTERSEGMSVGQWVGTILLTNCLGLISLILLFVWGFGDTAQPKKNYCRGMLIVWAIGVGVVILYLIAMFACVGSLAGGLTDALDELYYY